MKIRLEYKSVLLPWPSTLGALVYYCWDTSSLGIVMEDSIDTKDQVKVLWSRLPDERCRRPIKQVEEHLSIAEFFQDILQVLKLFFQNIIESVMTFAFFATSGFGEEHFLSCFDL